MFFVSRPFQRLCLVAVLAMCGLLAMGQTKMDEHDHGYEPERASSAVDNPYLALHATVPMEDFFAESERRIREKLEALRPIAEKEPIPGIEFRSTMIAVNTTRWPQYRDALTAFSAFALISHQESGDYLREQLLNRGFRIEDLPHLELLKESLPEGVSKQADSAFQKIIATHPLSYLDKPTVAQLEAVSVDDMREYMDFQRKARKDAEREKATDFMLKLTPHSQRVVLAYIYDALVASSGGRNYHLGYTNEAIARLREQMIDHFRKQEGDRK